MSPVSVVSPGLLVDPLARTGGEWRPTPPPIAFSNFAANAHMVTGRLVPQTAAQLAKPQGPDPGMELGMGSDLVMGAGDSNCCLHPKVVLQALMIIRPRLTPQRLTPEQEQAGADHDGRAHHEPDCRQV